MGRGGSVVVVLGVLALACGGESRRTLEGDASPSAGSGGAGGGPKGVSYRTDFSLTESPLSEGGAWRRNGGPWTSVATAGGIAFGTQPVAGDRVAGRTYNDSYAYLSGFPPDQGAEGVISFLAVDPDCTHEVALLLRWSDDAKSARGYECNLAFDGSYAQIVRWNGAPDDYEFLATGVVPEGVHDGDRFDCELVGGRLTLSVNGVERANVTDSTFDSGDPGIAFWRGLSGCGALGDFAFTSFAAWSIPK